MGSIKIVREAKEFDDDSVYGVEETYHIRDQLYAKIETDLDGCDFITLDELDKQTKLTSKIVLAYDELKTIFYTTKKLRDKLNDGEIQGGKN